MKNIDFDTLIQNYRCWKNSERDASKLDSHELLYSYLFESEFLMGAIYALRLSLQQSISDCIPFADSESNFLQFLTVEELLVLCETVSEQRIKECNQIIDLVKNELK